MSSKLNINNLEIMENLLDLSPSQIIIRYNRKEFRAELNKEIGDIFTVNKLLKLKTKFEISEHYEYCQEIINWINNIKLK